MRTAVAHNAVFEPFLLREYGFSGELFLQEFFLGGKLYSKCGSKNLGQMVYWNIHPFSKPLVLCKVAENQGSSRCGMTSTTIPERDNSCDFMGCFWLVLRLLLIIGILCCCSTGYFIRRRVHPYPPPGEPDFNVAFTRYPIMSPGNLSVCPCPANTVHGLIRCVCWQDCVRLAFTVMETQRLQSFPLSTQCRPTPVTWLQCIQPCRTASLLLPMIRPCRTRRRNKQNNTVLRNNTIDHQ